MTKTEYQELIEKIRSANRAYEDGSSFISDYEYDQMTLALRAAEKAHPDWREADSPSQTVGAPVKRTAGVTVEHDVPMLSIQDVFSTEDVVSWMREVRAVHPDAKFAVEQKIDGLSMSLRYENGELRLAETRGDGLIGEDVTVNALVIPDVLQNIADTAGSLEVRGEVYMTREAFDRVNAAQEANGKEPFANPRNCAAGTLRQLDPRETKKRGLSFFIFNVQRSDDASYMRSHEEGLEKLRALGMHTVPSVVCTTEEEVLREIARIGEIRGDLAYDIDGAVVKLDQVAMREDFPAGAKYSAGHIAYKYPPEEKETVVREIEVSVGMTGRINPTAIFDPIRLCGTTVTRATLHNQDFIDSLHIGIGDTVVVYKSGEIIPKIRRSVPEKRPAGTTDFRLPDRCPACGEPVTREEGMSDVKCTNAACPAQLERHIINFVSRDAMDIKGFGEEYVKSLVREQYLKSTADLYELKHHRDELIEKGLVGKEKNTDKILAVIENSKNNPPERLLTGLAIPNVGKTSAKNLMRHFASLDELAAADIDTLLAVPDVGQTTAETIVHFFENPGNKALMERFRGYGLRMAEERAENASEILKGKTIVITGSLTHFANRQALVDVIEQNGGKAAGSVSGKTSYLINNDTASNSGKNKKAKELGIPVISEEEFLKLLEIE